LPVFIDGRQALFMKKSLFYGTCSHAQKDHLSHQSHFGNKKEATVQGADLAQNPGAGPGF
jgi:hypothetical protein